MQELIQCVIAVVVIMGIVVGAQSLYEHTYSPPAVATEASTESELEPECNDTQRGNQNVAPLKCAFVIAKAYRERGKGIPGLNGPALNLGLVRPVGEIIASALPAATRPYFREVVVVSEKEKAKNADVIITPGDWAYGADTGYQMTGLELVYASGEAFVSFDLDARIEVRNGETFEMKESVHRVTIPAGGLCPAAKMQRIMTEATDAAVGRLSRQLAARIAAHPEVVEMASK